MPVAASAVTQQHVGDPEQICPVCFAEMDRLDDLSTNDERASLMREICRQGVDLCRRKPPNTSTRQASV
jgi:hypothetical protein